jgi:hypothetical protein
MIPSEIFISFIPFVAIFDILFDKEQSTTFKTEKNPIISKDIITAKFIPDVAMIYPDKMPLPKDNIAE